MRIKLYENRDFMRRTQIKLMQEEVHIWCIRWKEVIPVFEYYQLMLDQKEKEKMEEYYFYEDRMRYVAGKVITKLVLIQYLEEEEMPNARIVCLGGATEASIWSNYYEPKEINNKWFSIPYGYPLTNQKYYVMNADGLICPDNVPGELCIAGEGLAKEYVNDKKLTIEKFQYNEDIEQRIYKTGDRGVCVEGCIWYLGREDTQIKRRGYRIELGEIESILNSVTGIKASKVVYKDSQLLAFVVPEQDFSWEISDIETIIKGKLPQFNLPDSITILERFPENINGKIDMAKLCDYANNKIGTKERLENNIEKQIAEVWRRILGLKETIIYDVDFFQCGGNSLKAVEVIAEINHLFQGLELEIKDLFLNSTIKKISLKVEDELKKFMIVEEGTI